MIITICYGDTRWGEDAPHGTMRIDPAVWLREKGGVRDFRKILKLCKESDTDRETYTLSEWKHFLEAEPARIKQEALETAREYNRLRDHIEHLYDDPGKPVEAKREDLKQMRQELRELKAGYERKMKQLAKVLEQVRALMEEVGKV